MTFSFDEPEVCFGVYSAPEAAATSGSAHAVTSATAHRTAAGKRAASRIASPSAGIASVSTSPASRTSERPVRHPTCQQFEAGPAPFAYRCDGCHRWVLRAARQLFVYCCKSCQRTVRIARRRLLRRFPSLDRSLQERPEALRRPRGPPVGRPRTLRPHERPNARS